MGSFCLFKVDCLALPDRKATAKSPQKKRILPLKVITEGDPHRYYGSPFVGTPAILEDGTYIAKAWGFREYTYMSLLDDQLPPKKYTKGTIREHIEVRGSYGPVLASGVYDWSDYFDDVVIGEGHKGEFADENAAAFDFDTKGYPNTVWVNLWQHWYVEQASSSKYKVPSYVFTSPGKRELPHHSLRYRKSYHERLIGGQ